MIIYMYMIETRFNTCHTEATIIKGKMNLHQTRVLASIAHTEPSTFYIHLNFLLYHPYQYLVMEFFGLD